MSYNIKIIKKQSYKTNTWSGGKTTQLYIYPENSSYESRDFKWRISSAIVEHDESIFTKLQEVERQLMVIDGELLLKHKNHHEITLNKFDVDSFYGNWDTRSYGKATDFNLMTNKGCSGKLEHINLKSKVFIEDKENIEKSNYRYIFNTLYSLNGNFNIELESGKLLKIDEGDLVIVKKRNNCFKKLKLINQLDNNIDIIKSTIYY
ncbi:MAG: HutD family protein [Paraclostridium sp.]|uniref:HutD family protein n=1 Tax=Paraclostridium sp. TaxID=2023273 RepID=UPI003F3CF979